LRRVARELELSPTVMPIWQIDLTATGTLWHAIKLASAQIKFSQQARDMQEAAGPHYLSIDSYIDNNFISGDITASYIYIYI